MEREQKPASDSLAPHAERESARPAGGRAGARRIVPIIAIGTVVVVIACATLSWRARASINKVALGQSPRPVSTTLAKSAEYRPDRSYVGTLESWIESNVGPQYVSAYVETVLVRPGAQVRRGDVLATLNCANATATSAAVEMQARAAEDRQRALEHEASRVQELLDGGFISPNEVELKTAQSTSERAQVLAARAKLRAASLDVSDCVLRAPFDGEVATRSLDPGAFVHPGEPIVSIVDRHTIRFSADVPERDFSDVPPGAPIVVEVLATGVRRDGVIARRAPKADAATRTVHIEADLDDPQRAIPVGTTGLLEINVGQPQRAIEVPIYGASIHESKARLFVVDGDVARAKEIEVLGERGGTLFLAPTLAEGTPIVTEGRALLHDGDPIAPKEDRAPAAPRSEGGARGGGFGRPQ